MLNKTLYDFLTTFGAVTFEKEGEAQIVAYCRDHALRLQIDRDRLVSGEYLKTRCPRCRRNSMYVCHTWGVKEEQTNDARWWLVHCFVCESKFDASWRAELRSRYRQWLFDGGQAAPRVVAHGVERPPAETIPMPAGAVPLDQLPAGHRAIQYLVARGFDPSYLAQCYGVCVAEGNVPEHPIAQGRIIVPVLDSAGVQRCWQARYPADGVDPKYYNPRGSRLRDYVYGLPTQQQVLAGMNPPGAPGYFPLPKIITIVEGVPSVWRLGWGACALFGHSCTSAQFERLCSFSSIPIVVAFDGISASGTDTSQDAYAIGQRLRAAGARWVTIAELPPYCQPDGLHRRWQFWSIVLSAAQHQGCWGVIDAIKDRT
jgi:hypothetical protein